MYVRKIVSSCFMINFNYKQNTIITVVRVRYPDDAITFQPVLHTSIV